MWAKQLSWSWGCWSQPTRECMNHENCPSRISLSVLRNTRKLCIEVWLYYVCITYYLATCKCGLSLISSHHMFVWWHGKPCHSPFLLWVIWGVCVCPKQSFILHVYMVVGKHREKLYAQTRTAVTNRAHIMGIEHGSVQKTHLIKMVFTHRGSDPRWL